MSRKRLAFILLFLPMLWLAISAWQVYAFAHISQTQKADAAIVLGAAVFGQRPSPIFRERINHAITLYQQGYVNALIFTGGQGGNHEPTEADAAADYAIARGIPASAILRETNSTDTAQNLACAEQIAQAHGLTTFLIVSTPFHMKRALALSEQLHLQAHTSPTQTTRWISPATKFRVYARELLSWMLYTLQKPFLPAPTCPYET